MSKNRIKKQSSPAITSREGAEQCVGVIAIVTLNQIKTTARMDAEIADVRARYEGALAVIDEQLKGATAAVQAWAEANPDAFPKDRKSIKFVQGTIGFRTGTPKLALLNRTWNWDKVLAAVQGMLPNFIRSKPEVDREAIIAQRDDEAISWALPQVGLKVAQDETFYVEPLLTDVEIRQVTELSGK